MRDSGTGTAMKKTKARICAIGTAVPDHEIHQPYIAWATGQVEDRRERALFARMAERSGIDHRWSVLPRAAGGGSPVDPGGYYAGGRLPSTARRMEFYAEHAPELALAAIADLGERADIGGITHLVVASCTGFVAPGVDQIIARRLGLGPDVERTLVGFMGCYAAVTALRLAHHIVRSEPEARVLVVTVELSSLHFHLLRDLEGLLAGLQFGDGAAAALVTSSGEGLILDRFFCTTLDDAADLIGLVIGDEGFEMTLSGKVPGRLAAALADSGLRRTILGQRSADDLRWAIHPGGRSILDAVEHGLDLPPDSLAASREVLARFGNMSSATLMFVLQRMMAAPQTGPGVAMAFGPGLAAECFAFGG